MSEATQASLQRVWNAAPWMEAKAWGLREGWREFQGDKLYGLLPWVASKLSMPGGGCPVKKRVRKLFKKMDQDLQPASQQACQQASQPGSK